MDKLTYELRALCKQNRDGSHGTQAQRLKQLKLFAKQLKQLGFKHMGMRSLKTKHVKELVANWLCKPSKQTNKPISSATIKNRMAALRWWAGKIGKPGVIPKNNKDLGIPNRQRLSGHNKAFTVTKHQLKNLPSYLSISIRLQQEFGLRREEAAKFVPAIAVQDNQIELKASWTKGGRRRTIPITTAGQRALLKDIAELKQNASLIPAKMEFKQYISHRDHHLAKVNIRQAHGLRHHYAQQRYITLSNGLTPPILQEGLPVKLTPADQALDAGARLIVANELGHARISVTRDYLD